MDSFEEDVIIERLFGAKKAGGGRKPDKKREWKGKCQKEPERTKKVMWRGKCFGFTKPRLWGYFWQWGLLIQTHALPTVPVFVNLPGG